MGELRVITAVPPQEPPSISGIVAQIVVPARDLKASARFYVQQLGLRHEFYAPNVASLRSGNTRILLTHQPDFEAHGGVTLYIAAKGIEAAHANLVERGAPDRGAPHVVATLGSADILIAFVADPSGIQVGLIEERPSNRKVPDA
jgi:predicted enzyme related to lactoylglutathione lyase